MSDLCDLNFNSEEVEPNDRGLVPNGDQVAAIVEAEKKAGKTAGNYYLKLVFQICEGACQNRKLFENLNLWHTSTQAVQIAKGTLSAICRAIGVSKLVDTSQLLDKPMIISVGSRKGQNDEMENVIKSYKTKLAQPQKQAEELPYGAKGGDGASAGGKPW